MMMMMTSLLPKMKIEILLKDDKTTESERVRMKQNKKKSIILEHTHTHIKQTNKHKKIVPNLFTFFYSREFWFMFFFRHKKKHTHTYTNQANYQIKIVCVCVCSILEILQYSIFGYLLSSGSNNNSDILCVHI